MTIQEYIGEVARRYALGNATEHTFRGDLQRLVETLVPEIRATNEPKRIECGAPDYVITRKDIPVGYIEAKDVGVDLEGKTLKEQFDRYRDALDNLVFTDYLDFQFYVNGERTASIKIGEIRNGKIVPLSENFVQFTNLIKEFCSRTPVTIKSSKRLAEMMAEKAKILAYIIKNALDEDIASNTETDLRNQMKAFKDILIHDIDAKSFADIYAQTIAYGMFAARLHDKNLATFSRQEAAEKIPKTNPFLRKLFQFIATYDLDRRIDWIVDALADLFRATDIAAILKNFGKSTQTHDPIMHFYETFLAEYDPKLRKSRGVFYTPEPVVDFIVRAVDDILKSEFNLPNGLADTSKTKIKVDVQGKLRDTEVHKVQILDPATGTGTFLATVIKHIYKGFENQQGVWNQYVDEHLIPRLNGFELLMASYAMAHLKLDLLLSETGYKEDKDKRFQIYLTNALEEYHPDTGTLFASWLSTEAIEANHIKRDTPVMVVIGNPPYSVSSSNRSEWIESLMRDYKTGLTDKNLQPLSDDYLKFIRFGQHFIDKNGEGILAYITNNSFLDGIIHRKMRENLLACFDQIYILDLHGSSKKNEVSSDGTKDENVFDIQTGVSINILVKKSESLGKPCEVFKADMFGTRNSKYDELSAGTIGSMNWERVEPKAERFYFKSTNVLLEAEYEELVPLNTLFLENGAGVQTKRDNLFVDFDKDVLIDRIERLLNGELSEAEKTDLNVHNSSSYRLLDKILKSSFDQAFIRKYNYRIFDDREIYYDRELLGRAFYGIMRNMLKPNFSLITCAQQSSFDFQHCFLTREITDHHSISMQTREESYFFPLYLYPEENAQPTLDGRTERVPNLNFEIVNKIAVAIGLSFVAEKVPEATGGNASVNERASSGSGSTLPNGRVSAHSDTFAPIDILDYIYAVLHSPSYREKYKEFLKIDFPRVPYPRDTATFWSLVALGSELRQIHLLESPKVNRFITGFPVGGDNVVEKPEFKNPVTTAPGSDPEHRIGDVFINGTQFFSNVPEIAWNFHIGGYQPAQKWLKDRKGRKLSFDDIQHYQKIIVALTETDRRMKEIDLIQITS